MPRPAEEPRRQDDHEEEGAAAEDRDHVIERAFVEDLRRSDPDRRSQDRGRNEVFRARRHENEFPELALPEPSIIVAISESVKARRPRNGAYVSWR